MVFTFVTYSVGSWYFVYKPMFYGLLDLQLFDSFFELLYGRVENSGTSLITYGSASHSWPLGLRVNTHDLALRFGELFIWARFASIYLPIIFFPFMYSILFPFSSN